MAGEAVTAMIVAADAGDNPLADRREDREAAAAREKKAKVAKPTDGERAMEVVRAQRPRRSGAEPSTRRLTGLTLTGLTGGMP